MKKSLVISTALFAGLFLFLSVSLWAASEFYTIQLESFVQDKHKDWNNVEKIVRSVQGVTKVQIDKQTNTLRMFCVSRGCNEQIVSKVTEKLKENRYTVKAQGRLPDQQGFPKVDRTPMKLEPDAASKVK
jgi:nitrogen regulatory protein PII-like uncharacterized protein